MKNSFLIILLVIISLSSYGETNYDAVILQDSTTITYVSNSKLIENKRFTITINNQKGKEYSFFELQYNPFIKIKSVQGKILDKNKKVIKKISLKEIRDKKLYTNSFVDDERILTYYPTILNYPFTIEWEYSMEYNPFYLKNWSPSYINNGLIKKATLVFIDNGSNNFKYKELNKLPSVTKKTIKNQDFYIWEVVNFNSPDNQNYLPNQINFLPYLKISPKTCYFFESNIDISNWETIGDFIYNLNKSKSQFDSQTEQFIKDLVKDAKNDIEKMKILYSFLQNNTRYISIGIGSGGFIPLSAQYVHNNKYGDCKALTNYLKSMLDVVGIDSYYTLVYSGSNNNKIVTSDFPSLTFNHVILCVPNSKDTIWLECTNPKAPFNFLGDFTSNRYALLIKPLKSELVKTQTYSPEISKKNTTYRFYNWTNNTVNLDLKIQLSGDLYEDFNEIYLLDQDKQKEYIKYYLDFHDGDINSFEVQNFNEDYPISELLVKFTLDVSKYKINNKLYIPSILFHNKNTISNSFEERKYPFENNICFTEIDSIFIEVPNGKIIYFLPNNDKKETIFGNYEINYLNKNNIIEVNRKLLLNSFNFEPEKFNGFKNYYEDINKNDNSKIIFN